jgi:hypothetical protein
MVLWDRRHAQLWSTTSPFVSEGLSDEDNPGNAKRVKQPRPRPRIVKSLKFRIGTTYAKNRRNARYKNRNRYFR